MSDRFQEMQKFSLPTEFLTFEDILMDNNFKKQSNTTNSIFPSEFPYDFNQNVNVRAPLNHPLHPIAYYTNFEKSGASQLAHVGPSQMSSTPTSLTGSGRDSWDLVYQAAAEIAKLKVKGVDVLLSDHRKLLHQHLSQMPPRISSAFYKAFVERVREEQLLKQQQQRCMWSNNHAQNSWNFEKQNRVGGSTLGVHGKNEQVAWGSLQYMRQQNQENRTISQGTLMNGGSRNQFSGGVKKQSSGTGVFLPRSYGANNHNNIKKSSCLTTPILDRGAPGPGRNFNVIGSNIVQPPGQTCFVDGFDSDYDVQLAKMKLYLMQKRQHIRPGSFPQEGTY